MGGYFLEYNNFIPADPLKTPAHIAPVWYFTPYYSILRATTTELMYVLAAGLVVLVAFYWREIPVKLRPIVLGVAAVLLAAFFLIEAKVWGVVLMGASVLVFFLLPWLDRAPVKSIRYKGPFYKTALAVFVVAFLILGWLGTEAPTALYTRIAQVGTLIYFGFFVLMPWYSKIDSHKPVPDRVTWK
jgi:ubiquinol-cytochrome c reductase cytochrome b subunit